MGSTHSKEPTTKKRALNSSSSSNVNNKDSTKNSSTTGCQGQLTQPVVFEGGPVRILFDPFFSSFPNNSPNPVIETVFDSDSLKTFAQNKNILSTLKLISPSDNNNPLLIGFTVTNPEFMIRREQVASPVKRDLESLLWESANREYNCHAWFVFENKVATMSLPKPGEGNQKEKTDEFRKMLETLMIDYEQRISWNKVFIELFKLPDPCVNISFPIFAVIMNDDDFSGNELGDTNIIY